MTKCEAIKHFGSVVRLAEALDIKPQAVSQWGEQIPMRRAYEIERLTEGRLRAMPESKEK